MLKEAWIDKKAEELGGKLDFIAIIDDEEESPVEPCEDAISREAAKEAIRKAFPDLADRVEINSVLNDLPTVTPKQRTGESEVNAALDKIKAELHATAELHVDGDYYLRDEWIDEIFDKYKAESEEQE